MVRVYLPDSWLESVVEGGKPDMLGVARLVDRIVPGYPGVAFVVSGKLLPKPYRPILVVLVVPEGCMWCWVVRMPVSVLPTWCGMQVEDRINAIFGTLLAVSDPRWELCSICSDVPSRPLDPSA